MNAENKQNGYSLAQFNEQVFNGLIGNNPTLVQILGTCPMLATTTSVKNAIGMGLATTAVLVFSNLFISLFRKLIPQQVRIAIYIVIISGFVTSVEMLIKAFLPALDASLGVFIPLIVVNCIIIARAEVFASKNPPLPSVVDGLTMGLGFTLALSLLGTVREILGAGAFFGISLFGGAVPPMLFFIMPPGAFLTLGFIIAGMRKLLAAAASRKNKREAGEPAAPMTDAADLPAPGEFEFVADGADAGSGGSADEKQTDQAADGAEDKAK